MKRITHVETTEEMILNYGALPSEMDGWRYYRIEYYGAGPYAVEERAILCPPNFDRDALEKLFEDALGQEEREL